VANQAAGVVEAGQLTAANKVTSDQITKDSIQTFKHEERGFVALTNGLEALVNKQKRSKVGTWEEFVLLPFALDAGGGFDGGGGGGSTV
jgi:hypothetical protein